MPLPPETTVLQVIPALETGGAERTTLDVAAAVAAAGGRALVASEGGRLEGELAALGGQLRRLPVASKAPWVMAANARALRRLIRDEGVDLVHVRSRAPAFSALWAARRAGVPIVATYHGVYNARSGLKRWWNGVMTRGDAVIANSAFTRDHLLAEHADTASAKVTVIPRGIDLERFDPAAVAPERFAALRSAWGIGAEERRPVLLLAGRLTGWKGQALLVEALARLAPAERPLTILAGDDQGRSGYRAALERQIAEAGLAGDVRLVGHCADMPAAYLLADLACAPSLEPEAFGRTAVEPQAMGRPVLAAAHGATAETVVDGVTGWLVPPGDADAWTAALRRALALSAAERATMGAAGRAQAAHSFSVKSMTAATLAVYERLLQSGAARP